MINEFPSTVELFPSPLASYPITISLVDVEFNGLVSAPIKTLLLEEVTPASLVSLKPAYFPTPTLFEPEVALRKVP